jgi:hypothetical protein
LLDNPAAASFINASHLKTPWYFFWLAAD